MDRTRIRRIPRRLWPILLAAAALAAAVAAFLAWGPIGLGSGPLSVGGGGDYGPDPNLVPLAVLDSVDAGDTGAVIDSVALVGGRYPAPHLTAVRAAANTACAGFLPIHGSDEALIGGCFKPGDLHALLGRPIPARSAVIGPPTPGLEEPGITMILEVTPPGSRGCWEITALVVHYHVGIRHYTQTAPQEVLVCRTEAEVNRLIQSAQGTASAGQV